MNEEIDPILFDVAALKVINRLRDGSCMSEGEIIALQGSLLVIKHMKERPTYPHITQDDWEAIVVAITSRVSRYQAASANSNSTT